MNSLVVKADNADVQIKGKDFVLALTDYDKTIVMLESRLKLILTTYNIRQNIGIPWLEYLNNTNIEVRHEYIATYIFREVSSTEGINLESIEVTHVKTENRVAEFSVTCTYGKDEQLISLIIGG